MFYRSNPYRKDNPRWVISNPAESCARCIAWCIGLARRAGTRLHAPTDAEARWRSWQVTESRGGLVHQYRDERFSVRREKLPVGLAPPAGDR